jgi:mevalonate kinase
MSLSTLLADATSSASGSALHQVAIGLAGTIITGASSVAAWSVKSLVRKVDHLTKELISSQRAHSESMQRSAHEQIEAIQQGHAQFIESMDGTIRDNTHALTAITVQLGIQSRELQRMEQTIQRCPGNIANRQQANEPIDFIP